MAKIDFLGNPDFRVNEYGRIALIHKTIPNLIAELPYPWHTELVILDETDGRRVVGHKPYSYFDDDDWSVVTKKNMTRLSLMFLK